MSATARKFLVLDQCNMWPLWQMFSTINSTSPVLGKLAGSSVVVVVVVVVVVDVVIVVATSVVVS